MTIDIVNKLHESGELRSLIQAGIVSVSWYSWRQIYNSYIKRVAEGCKKTQAVNDTCDTFDVSESTVYRVIDRMKFIPPTKNN